PRRPGPPRRPAGRPWRRFPAPRCRYRKSHWPRRQTAQQLARVVRRGRRRSCPGPPGTGRRRVWLSWSDRGAGVIGVASAVVSGLLVDRLVAEAATIWTRSPGCHPRLPAGVVSVRPMLGVRRVRTPGRGGRGRLGSIWGLWGGGLEGRGGRGGGAGGLGAGWVWDGGGRGGCWWWGRSV